MFIIITKDFCSHCIDILAILKNNNQIFTQINFDETNKKLAKDKLFYLYKKLGVRGDLIGSGDVTFPSLFYSTDPKQDDLVSKSIKSFFEQELIEFEQVDFTFLKYVSYISHEEFRFESK